jgi:adenylate kinase
MTPQTYIFFGPSGSGKGKQAELLMEEIKKEDPEKKIIYIETGEKMRELARIDSLTGKKVNEILDGGTLAPIFLPIHIWSEYMIDNLTENEHIILDGTPRRLEEASVLDSAIQFYKRENPIVISLEVSDETTTKRLLGRGREDDNEKEIKKRLDFYHKDVMPAIEYFKKNPYYKFIAINGEPSIEDVHQEIMKQVGI